MLYKDAREKFQGHKFYNPDFGREIVVTGRGLKHIKAVGDVRKAQALLATDKILTRGVYLGEAPSDTSDNNIRKYHYLATKVSINGDPLIVTSVIRETPSGELLYDFGINDIPAGISDDETRKSSSLRPAAGHASRLLQHVLNFNKKDGDIQFSRPGDLYGQTNLFGDPVNDTATQPAMFDMNAIAADAEAQHKDELEQAYGRRTADYITSMEGSPNKRVARVAAELADARKLVRAKGDGARSIVEDAADALDTFAIAAHQKEPIDLILRQYRLDDVELNPRTRTFAKAMDNRTFPGMFRKELSELATDVQFDAAQIRKLDAQERQLAREFSKYMSAPLPALAKIAKFEVNDGVIAANTAGLTLIRRAMGQYQPDQGPFYGFFADQGLASGVAAAVHSLKYQHPTKRFEEIGQMFKDAVDNTHGDLTIIPDFGGPVGTKTTQEEFIHRLNRRSGARDEFGKIQDKPGIQRGLEGLNSSYDNLEKIGAVDEVTAKSLHDDGERELGITPQEKYAIWDDLRIGLADAGILLDYTAEAATISKAGKEFADYATKDQRPQRTSPTWTERTGEISTDTGSGKQVREGSISDTGLSSEANPHRLAKLRQTDLHGRGEGPNEVNARRAARPANREAANLPNGVAGNELVSPAETRYINKHSRGNTDLANAASQELAFARAKDEKMTVGDYAVDTLNMPKAIKASFDLSAAGRQGWITALAHPALAAKAFKKQLLMLPPVLGAKAHHDFKRDLNLHPFIELAENSKLFLATHELKPRSSVNTKLPLAVVCGAFSTITRWVGSDCVNWPGKTSNNSCFL